MATYGDGGRGAGDRRLRDRLAHPRIDIVESEPPDLFTALDAGQVDMAIAVDFATAPPHTDKRYVRTDLLTDALDLAVPVGHPPAGRGRGRVALRELAGEAWIVR